MFRRGKDTRAERARRNERRVEQLRQVRREIRERSTAARATERTDKGRAPRLEALREEARYRRERLALYKARLYGGRPLDERKLRDLQRSSDSAGARVTQAEQRDSGPTRPA